MNGTETTLEALIRDSAVTNGSINLSRINGGRWRAIICHHANGTEHPYAHMIHPFNDWEDDPVEALRKALIEDERQCRDLARRYAAAPKAGKAGPTLLDDLQELLG